MHHLKYLMWSFFKYDLSWFLSFIIICYYTILLWYLFDILLSIHHGDKLWVTSFSFDLIVCVWLLEDFHVHLFWCLNLDFIPIIHLISYVSLNHRETFHCHLFLVSCEKLNWSLCCCLWAQFFNVLSRDFVLCLFMDTQYLLSVVYSK